MTNIIFYDIIVFRKQNIMLSHLQKQNTESGAIPGESVTVKPLTEWISQIRGNNMLLLPEPEVQR